MLNIKCFKRNSDILYCYRDKINLLINVDMYQQSCLEFSNDIGIFQNYDFLFI